MVIEIPCHFRSQIEDSLFKIHTKCHGDSMSFIQVLCDFHGKTWHGFWTSSSLRISMVFAKEMMGFPSDLVSFSNQTAVEKTWENPCLIFHRASFNNKIWTSHDGQHIALGTIYDFIAQQLTILDVSGVAYPVQNVTRIFSCLLDGNLVWFQNETNFLIL